MLFAAYELYHTLREAFSEARKAADLRRRLGSWWWCCTHQHLLDAPPPDSDGLA